MEDAHGELAQVRCWLCENLDAGDAGRVCGMLSAVSRRLVDADGMEAENEELRNRIEELESYVTAPPLEEQLLEALDENKKLRELVLDFDKCLDTAIWLAREAGYPVMPDQKLFDSLPLRMRDLGIGAGDGLR